MSRSPYSKAALKRGSWHFLSGKAVTGTLTFLILLALVRLLPITEYAAYVAFAAALELAYPIASCGLPWMASRYLPEFRLHAEGRRTRRLVATLLAIAVGLLAAMAGLMLLGLDSYLRWARLDAYRTAASLFVAMFVLEYTSRFVRENLLGPLMQQIWVRGAQVARQSVFLLLLLGQHALGRDGLIYAVGAELTAAAIGVTVAIAGLFRHLATIDTHPAAPDWAEPRLAVMWKTARNMYLARLLTLSYSPQALVLLVQRVLSAEAVALFGFVRGLFLQISNNLPATLLFSLIQPKLVASRVSAGVDELTRNANLAGKLSLFALMPLLAASAVGGERLVALASGHKFPEAGLLFFGFMLVLVPFSQRLLLETVAVSTGHSRLCTYAALSGLTVLPVLALLLHLQWGLWAPVATLALGYCMFNLIVQAWLRRLTSYRSDPMGTAKLLGAAAAGALATLPFAGMRHELLALLAIAVVATVVYLLAAWGLKPFSAAERDRLNTLFKRRVFVW
jgi:O-antigen/teichoic acid export membrane protein